MPDDIVGQAVADLLGVQVLSKDQIRKAAGSDAQRAALDESEFLTRTPLWYYVLAEAKALHDGAHLGPVGSTIVAEVLIYDRALAAAEKTAIEAALKTRYGIQ